MRSVRFAPSVSESDSSSLTAQLQTGSRGGGHNKASINGHKIIHIVLLPMQCVILVLWSSEQCTGCLSHEPGLVSLALTSLL